MNKVKGIFRGKARDYLNDKTGGLGGSLLDSGMDLYHREKSAMEEASTVDTCVMIFQLIFNVGLTAMYAYFLVPFQYKKYHVGTPGNMCFATAFNPHMNSTLEEAYSPYAYNGTL